MRFIVLILALTMAAAVTAGCQQEPEVTGSTSNKCVAELFSAYNPKDLNQCLAVCSRCDRGTMVTCSTSCKLRGAG
jgi:hypothetical protein